MALTATASQGFEKVAEYGGEIVYTPGDPGDAIKRGDALFQTAAEGIVDLAAAAEAPIGFAAYDITVPAATVGIPRCAAFDPLGTLGNLHLVPVLPRIPLGTPIYEVTFAGHFDDTVAAYTAATPSLTLTVSPGANDDTNGALIYVYEGPGAGVVLTGADYVHTSKVLTTHSAALTALTAASKVIILEGEGGGVGGIGWFGRIEIADQNNLNAAQGYNDGDWVVFMSYEKAAGLLHQLKLRVIPAMALTES